MQNRVLTAGVAIILLFGIVMTGSIAFEESVTAADPTTVTNETWAVDQGNVTELDESNRDVIYNESAGVYDDTGTLVQADGNYSWLSSNGTVKALDGSSALTDGSEATITYGFYEPSESQQTLRTISTGAGELGEVITLALTAGLLLAALVVAKRQGGV